VTSFRLIPYVPREGRELQKIALDEDSDSDRDEEQKSQNSEELDGRSNNGSDEEL
jgi:hypothetical protein